MKGGNLNIQVITDTQTRSYSSGSTKDTMRIHGTEDTAVLGGVTSESTSESTSK